MHPLHFSPTNSWLVYLTVIIGLPTTRSTGRESYTLDWENAFGKHLSMFLPKLPDAFIDAALRHSLCCSFKIFQDSFPTSLNRIQVIEFPKSNAGLRVFTEIDLRKSQWIYQLRY